MGYENRNKRPNKQQSELTLKLLDLEKKNPAIGLLRKKLGLKMDYVVSTKTGEYMNNEDFLKDLQNLKLQENEFQEKPTTGEKISNASSNTGEKDLWKKRKFGKK